jgi:UDP-N-acetylglucosamine 2-epimerase
MKCAFIVGARPNFIKLAPIYDIIHKYKSIQPILVHTGQHYDNNMSGVFFEELNLPKPDFHFNVNSTTQTKQTTEIMNKLEDLFVDIMPDVVVVIGDVSSTLAGSLVASKLNIKTAHIEAGLRSFNKTMPEEINRIVTDHVSDILFAPSQTALENLQKEGVESKSYFTGDLMYDAVLRNLPIAERKSEVLYRMNLKSKDYIFTTLHRPYNVDDPENLKNIFDKLNQLDIKVVFPVHPRTKRVIENNIIEIGKNILITEPVGYLDSLILQKEAYKVITDSGGMQKEAFFLKTPCLTLRPETEWEETVQSGANILVNKDVLNEYIDKEFDENFFMSNPYGDGNSAEKILELLKSL